MTFCPKVTLGLNWLNITTSNRSLGTWPVLSANDHIPFNGQLTQKTLNQKPIALPLLMLESLAFTWTLFSMGLKHSFFYKCMNETAAYFNCKHRYYFTKSPNFKNIFVIQMFCHGNNNWWHLRLVFVICHFCQVTWLQKLIWKLQAINYYVRNCRSFMK